MGGNMGIIDVLLIVLIVAFALYLLYRSFWKKKGYCSGCSSRSCGMKKRTDSKEWV